ncbi:MAG: hypothetical protein IKH01_03460 [Prevotella sp.]|nr:hypothetical protein [Prevotella sp.]
MIKKFTLLLVMLLGVLGVKAATSTQLALTGGYSYKYTGQQALEFTNYGHLSITATLDNFNVADYKSITINYTSKSGNFKIAAIGKVGDDNNHSFQETVLDESGSTTITFDADQYSTNEVDATKTIVYRVDLYSADDGTSSITINSVKLKNKSDEETTMEYNNKWNVSGVGSGIINFAGWSQMGAAAWQAGIADGTLHKYTITFGAAVPSGMILRFNENGLELSTNIAEGATSVDIYRTAAYSEFTLRNNTGDNKTVNISSVYRHVLTKNSSTKLNDDNIEFSSTWTNNTSLQGSNPKTQAVKVGDILEVTISTTGESDYGLHLCEGGTYNTFAVIPLTKGISTVQTHCVPLTSAKVVEAINERGIILGGQNVTVSSIAVVNNEESADDVLQNAPITITAAGIATYSNPRKLDFTGSDLKAYIATDKNDENHTVTMTRIYKVPANTGLYLVGDAKDYKIPYYSGDDTESITTNLLHGSGQYNTWVYESIPASNEYRYILAKPTSSEAGFYKVTSTGLTNTDTSGGTYNGKRYHSLTSHKAYLQTDSDLTPPDPGSAPALKLIFGGEGEGTTAINTVSKNPVVEDGIYYNLQGVAVKNPSKGLYILNGKKVIVK